MAIWYVGTSGFSFDDWVGTVYPENVRRSEMFGYYWAYYGFNCVELNFTFYQMPSYRTLVKLVRKSPDSFLFAIKLHQSITHAHDLNNVGPFLDACKIVSEEGRLIGYLAQFPYSFRYSVENTGFVDALASKVEPLFIEFRHDSWVEFCYRNSATYHFVTVDLPKLSHLFPALTFDTATVYYRFHGRNRNWFQADEKTRYDYNYTDSELVELIEKLVPETLNVGYVFFNNCYRGQALRNALRFRELVGERKVSGWLGNWGDSKP